MSVRERAKPDLIIAVALAGLTAISLTAVYTATRDIPGQTYMLKQVVWTFIGMGMLAAVQRLDYRLLAAHAHWLYAAGLGLLVSVFLFGKKVNGALSWIDLGLVSVQPSEIVRLTTLLMLARLYERHRGAFTRAEQLVKPLFVLMVPTLIVLVQPDLGMALIYLSMLGCFFLLARLARWAHVSAAAAVLLLTGGLYLLYTLSPDWFFQVVRPHQWERLTSFVHPENDPLGSGYQYIQAKKVVGSGTLHGTRMLRVMPMSAKLPEQHTDFIFAVIAQQWGFIGASLLLLCYLLMFYRLVDWAMHTPDLFAAFFLSGMVTMWSFQVFVNIGMNIGLSPITGLTLPFVSYGGSSLVSNLIAFGLILRMRRPSALWEIGE